MTMILSLVLPISITCIAIAVVSMAQTSRLVYESSSSALSLHMQNVVLKQEYEAEEASDSFPGKIAEKITGLRQTVAGFGGNLYVTDDGQHAWQVRADGEVVPAGEDFRTLRKAKYQFFWQAEDVPLQVLVVFPYNFTLRFLPPWFWVGIVLAVLSIAYCPILFRRLKKDILDPMDTLDTAIDGLKKDLSYRIPPQSIRNSDEFLKLFGEFNAMAQEVQSSRDKDVKMLETEMDNLRLQVNPHMLLNSYNMIYALAESKNYEVIQEYTLCLVDYFRYVLRNGQKVVSVRQELEFVENFIRIQRIRFPGRFSYVWQAEEDCMQALIPPLLIENFVENAVKYALEPGAAIEIVVSVRRELSDEGYPKLHIAITDTGRGIRPEILEKLKAREPYIDETGSRHIGIWNCLRRIELFYGDQGDLHIASEENQGTQVYLIVPFTEEETPS